MSQYSPTEIEVTTIVTAIHTDSPALGLQKVLLEIRQREPTWTLSEKRLKKILTESKARVFKSVSSAISRPTPNLTVPPSLMVRSSLSGKGLYAKQSFPPKEILFSETPYFWVPSLRVLLRILDSELCGYCGKEFKESSESLRSHCQYCPQSWCNRNCAAKDECHTMKNKYLTCRYGNRLWLSFLEFVVEKEKWLGGLMMGYLWSRIVCSASNMEATDLSGTSEFAETIASFSTISQEKRHENLPSWYTILRKDFNRRIFEEASMTEMWTTAHKLLSRALEVHPSYKALQKFLTYEQFLLHLGCFNTNNLSGSLYPLHTHINHSCRPNATVAEVGQSAKPMKIIVTAKDAGIQESDEITIAYVDPTWPRDLRRETLKRDYGFDCRCRRCEEELKASQNAVLIEI